ncbi:MAG: cation diffusion facilitator family transporter [Woeseiaceae bacterium]|nr:cation diffusion facilitator family transporter [Woeseiaceae bacterium]
MGQHHHTDGNMRRVVIALCLTGTFMVVEVIGGLLAGSLALLADAGHMLTDTMALGLAAAAFHVSKRAPDARRTFGYQRFQILAAFVNGLTLVVIVGWILFEAVMRFLEPREILGPMMLAVAAAGLAVNIVAFLVLHGGDQENLNIRGAALHVLGDLLGSVAAIIAALVVIYTGWLPIDPLLSVVVALLILRSAWILLRRSGNILLQGVPEWLDVQAMESHICEAVPAVGDIHHVHVWGLTPQDLVLTMHVHLDEEARDPTSMIREIKKLLKSEYGIGHSTIEVEYGDCADRDAPTACS